MIKQALILAAGLGTRLLPLTKETPKALVKIGDKPLLKILIDKLAANSFDRLIINVHHHSKEVKDYIKRIENKKCELIISDETDELLDTGGALKKAANLFDESSPLLIHNVDIISNIDLNKFWNEHLNRNNLCSLAVKDRSSSRKFLFDEEMNLSGWKNEKTVEKIITRKVKNLKELSFNGIQILNKEVFRFFPDKKVFSLVELYLKASREISIKGIEFKNEIFIDAGKYEGLRDAEKFLR